MRLVLCDDNRIFCEALAVALEARGHQALAIATTADEGVAAVARHQPDACLLDFRIAFQVVVTSTQNLVTLNANNQANAVSSNCVACSTFAAAYQIV